MIRFWKRFIDDCIGIWRGTKRSFYNFVRLLNAETRKYGIEFPITEVQFGRGVHVLDLGVYLDQDNSIQHRGYSKPTDSKRYLHPHSFHPKSIFNAIPYSQMLRTLRNNSKPDESAEELDICLKHFENSGYEKERLNEIKQRAVSNINNAVADREENETLVFPVHHFDGINEFKGVLRSLDNELKSLIGDVRILFAIKKRSSIGNSVVRNKQLSFPSIILADQRCNGPGCRQCPLSISQTHVTVNNKSIPLPRTLNCKSNNVIYLWLCRLCSEKEAYFGRTTQECHDRSSGHRGCFSEDKWEKSALSMHAKDMHPNQFSLENFSVALVKKVSPQQIRREEFRFIEKFRTIPFGLNRYKV